MYLNSTNKMRTSWNLINIERGKNMNNQIIESTNIGGKTTADHQTIADNFNKHFIMIPDTINKIILIIIIQLRLTKTIGMCIVTLWQMRLKLHFLV